MSRFHDDMTIGEARDILRELAGDGHACPLCTQLVKVYRRKINSGMARSLIAMWRAAGTEWQHIPTTVGGRSREEGKLRYWGLVEEMSERREDGGRAGWWRVTVPGMEFLTDGSRVRKYARVFDGRCLGFDGELVSIKEALGDHFDYQELMYG